MNTVKHILLPVSAVAAIAVLFGFLASFPSLGLAFTAASTSIENKNQMNLQDFLAVQQASAAQSDYFLKLEGIDGESTDDKHSGAIEIQSFSWGVSQSGSYHRFSGSAASGKVTMSDITIMKSVDKSSPKLFMASAQGEQIKQATLTARKSSSDSSDFYTIKLQDVMVSSFYTSTNNNSGAPVETVKLSFSKIEFEYQPQNADGTSGAKISAGWDLATNKKV